MPGKVNPIIPEAVIQAAAQVIGNDTVITLSGQAGNFDLIVMLPVMAHNLLQSIDLMSTASSGLAEKTIVGISADREKCTSYLEQSLALCTGLVPVIGYDKAAAIAKEAFRKRKTVREVASDLKVLPDKELNALIDKLIYEK